MCKVMLAAFVLLTAPTSFAAKGDGLAQTPIKPRMGRIKPSLSTVPMEDRVIVRKFPRREIVPQGEQVRRAPRTPGRVGALGMKNAPAAAKAAPAVSNKQLAFRIRLSLDLNDKAMVEAYDKETGAQYVAEAKREGYPSVSLATSKRTEYKGAIAYLPPEWQNVGGNGAALVVRKDGVFAVSLP